MAQVVVLKIYRLGQLVDEKKLNQSHIVIGSSVTESHVTLVGISSLHTSIEKRNDKYVVCDLGSDTGTFKNSDKILEAEVKPGDKIKVGDYSIEFWLVDVVEEQTTATSLHQKPVSEPSTTPSQTTANLSNVAPMTSSAPKQEPAPVAIPVQAATPVVDGVAKPKSYKKHETYAPVSPYKNVSEFIRPTKGTSVEVLVAWRERVISSHHFTESGTILVGTHPSCDVIVPLLTSNVNKVPLIQISNQAQIITYPGMEGVLVTDQSTTPFSHLGSIGRSGQMVTLQQGEMARITIGPDVEIVVRYSSQAPKPVVIPFLDLSSNGFLAVLLAIVVAGILSLWVALNKIDQLDPLDDEEYRTALILTNPPPPPPRPKVQAEIPPPQKEKPPERKVKKIVKLEEKKPEPKKPDPKPVAEKKKIDMSKPKRDVKPKATAKAEGRARGSGKDGNPRSMKPKDGQKTNQVTSSKQGGAVKTASKEGSQMQSERKLKNSGIFGAFGSGGRNNRLDTSYDGGGELAGMAENSTGTAGFSEDRAGDGLGSKFKDTGAGGNGKSNVGVSGLSKGGKGLGAGGFAGGGLGDRKAVSIIPGGSGEEFSGQIDREGIRKVFLDNQRSIRSCYERELNRDPNLAGILKLNFDIGELGRVVGQPSVNWGDSSMKSRSVASCILNRLKTWRFPEPPRNQVVNVIYPLAFSS